MVGVTRTRTWDPLIKSRCLHPSRSFALLLWTFNISSIGVGLRAIVDQFVAQSDLHYF
jgi:hypothetical protein